MFNTILLYYYLLFVSLSIFRIVESFEDILVSLINAENFTALEITNEDIALLARRVSFQSCNLMICDSI